MEHSAEIELWTGFEAQVCYRESYGEIELEEIYTSDSTNIRDDLSDGKLNELIEACAKDLAQKREDEDVNRRLDDKGL